MGFSSEFRAEADAALDEKTTIFRFSVQDLVEAVKLEGPSIGPPSSPGFGGFMPVQLGDLRRSLRASTSLPPQINPALSGGVADGAAEVAFVIAGADLGDIIHLGFTAAYAQAVNYGHGSFGGYHFVERNGAKWEAIVAENEARFSKPRS